MNMRAVVFIGLFLSYSLSQLFAQTSYKDNPYYQKSIEYRDLAQKALTNKDWKSAYMYSDKGIIELDKYKIDINIAEADRLIKNLKGQVLDKGAANELQRGIELNDSAKNRFAANDLGSSFTDSQAALVVLRKINPSASGRSVSSSASSASSGELVMVYTVVEGDCLWKISKKPMIYNDSHQWPKIYMSNKAKFKDPENPHLIFPDQVFDIPR
jgi:hypothetical protein